MPSDCQNRRYVLRFFIVVSLFFSSGISLAVEKDPDPWRKVNEKTHAFNEFFDRNLLKPVAKGYNRITPEPVNKGVTNFFRNLGEPVNFVNDILQAKFKDAGVDFVRFTVNTTFGLFGFFDIATRTGLQPNNEDFGQTLGKWGVPSGPYLVLPFLGPSTVRDGLAKIPATFTNLNPSVYVTDKPETAIAMTALNIVDSRADLLAVEKMIIGDRYVGMRDLFLQIREFEVRDGDVRDDFMDDDDW